MGLCQSLEYCMKGLVKRDRLGVESLDKRGSVD